MGSKENNFKQRAYKKGTPEREQLEACAREIAEVLGRYPSHIVPPALVAVIDTIEQTTGLDLRKSQLRPVNE